MAVVMTVSASFAYEFPGRNVTKVHLVLLVNVEQNWVRALPFGVWGRLREVQLRRRNDGVECKVFCS
jgi:hypothetical protein